MTKEERTQYFYNLGYSKEDMKNMAKTLENRGVLVNGKKLEDVKFKNLEKEDYAEIVSQYNAKVRNVSKQNVPKQEERTENDILDICKDKELHDNDFEQWVLNKLDSGNQKDITERDLRSIAWNYEIDRVEGDRHRWTKSVQSICELKGRLVAVDWQEGLTECQEDEFYNAPYYVQAVTKMVPVTNYILVEKGEAEMEEEDYEK